MLSLLIIVIILIIILLRKYILPVWRRYVQLRKDYKDITPLPVSRIPFIGNLYYTAIEPHLALQLSCELSKACQEQDKGLFCLWYSIWPLVIICSGRGLEVSILHLFSTTQLMSLFKIDIH